MRPEEVAVRWRAETDRRGSAPFTLCVALLALGPAAGADLRADTGLSNGTLEEFAACLAGPEVPSAPACAAMFDLDGDLDVDVSDLAAFQVMYTGPVPFGACCFDDYSCAILVEADCQTAGGGEWLGADTACADCVAVHVQQVAYGGSGSYTVKVDCPYPPCNNYASPQWLDANYDGDVTDPGDRCYPVAYLRNTSIVLSNVRFRVVPGGSVSNVPVHGLGPDGLIFEGTGDLAGNFLTVGGTLTSSAPLPDVVHYYDSFAIDWAVALDGATFYPAGTSSNCLYATYAAPLGDRLESYFHIGTQAASGTSTEQDVIDAIWTEFADREVYNAYGARLGYYRGVLCAADCTYYSAPELVCYTTSQCGGWADLMIQCLRTQGLGGALFVTAEPRGYPTLPYDCGSYPMSAAGFVVKNYNFFPNFPPPCLTYPYTFNDPCGYYAPWPTPTCTDAPGLPGQDNLNPASWFARHFIVKINLKYYDPSYGAGPFTGTQEEANLIWETNAIAGYFGVAWPSPQRLGVRQDSAAVRETEFDQ
jgi:hypothetical protein